MFLNPLLRDPYYREDLLYRFARADGVVMRYTFVALVMNYEDRIGMFHPKNPGTCVGFDRSTAAEPEIPFFDPIYIGC